MTGPPLAAPATERPKVTQGNIIDRDLSGKRSHAKIPQSKRRMIIAVFMVGAVVASSAQLLLLRSWEDSREPAIPARIKISPHDPISIILNEGFPGYDAVRSGSGSQSDPYIISDWEIDASGGNGIYIYQTTAYFIIRNVTIGSTTQASDGIVLESVSNAQIYNVTVSNCFNGIAMNNGCISVKINNSIISNCANCGIVSQFYPSTYVDISVNRISANGGTGIALDPANNFNLVSNNVSTDDPSSGGRRAVLVRGCTGGVLTANNLTAVYNEALYCTSSQGVLVATNRISSILGYGIYLSSCTGFLIYHNNFMGVYPQAFDSAGAANRWNESYDVGGNYWIDYTGEDRHGGVNQDQGGPDGFGDSDYTIDPNSIDHYPLNLTDPMEPIPEFPTLLLPIVSILSLLFAVVRRSSREEQ